jgi:protein-disulfide isomerase
MFATRRRLLMTASAGLLLAACQGKTTADQDDASDMTLGDPRAPVRIVEYASVTCPHCKEWHDTVWPQLKQNYIDTGKVRFIFREFPTNPELLAIAGFQLARCGGRTGEQYFNMLDVLFAQQIPLYDAYAQGKAKEKLLEIAKSSGMSEDEFTKCVEDPEGAKRINQTIDNGRTRFNITGTPTFIVNGKVAGADAVQYATLAKLIDKEISGAKAG